MANGNRRGQRLLANRVPRFANLPACVRTLLTDQPLARIGAFGIAAGRPRFNHDTRAPTDKLQLVLAGFCESGYL